MVEGIALSNIRFASDPVSISVAEENLRKFLDRLKEEILK